MARNRSLPAIAARSSWVGVITVCIQTNRAEGTNLILIMAQRFDLR
jgi:hypothetical protein